MSEIRFTPPEALAPTELERRLNLREQYEQQKQLLLRNGLVILLSSGDLGFIDTLSVDGVEQEVERPIPSYESLLQQIEANRELYLEKASQGFAQLELVPFGVPLATLKERYGELLKQKKAAGRLLSQTGEPLDLDTNQPVYLWDQLEEHADPTTSDNVVYGPKEFSANHGGQTKRQLLAAQTAVEDPWAGWEVVFKETTIVLPREGANEIIGGRQRIETNQSSNEYLKLLLDAQRALANPDVTRQELTQRYGGDTHRAEQELVRLLSYANEEGDTPEGWFAQAIQELDEHDRVLDDYARPDTGALCLLVGSYCSADSYVPSAYWYRGDRRASVGGHYPGGRNPSFGFRSRVRVPHP